MGATPRSRKSSRQTAVPSTAPRIAVQGRVKRWGASYALVIPKPVRERIGVCEGTEVNIEVEDEAPAAPPQVAILSDRRRSAHRRRPDAGVVQELGKGPRRSRDRPVA